MTTEKTENLPLLKNDKPHVSYSEVSTWTSCSYKHKLVYIDKLTSTDISPYLDYGTIIHDAAEKFIKTRKLEIEVAQEKIEKAWKERGFDTQEWIDQQTARADGQGWKYKHVKLAGWLASAKNCLDQLPEFLDEKYPGWEPVAAEHKLYEKVEAHPGYFKGFIDCVIKLPNGKNVVIDWKTSGPYGWRQDKQRDFLTTAQLILYKQFWMKITEMQSKDVKTAFILLKRDAKPGKSVGIVEVSAGPKALAKAAKMVSNMLVGMENGMALKNRHSCKFCEFFNTEHCT